MGNDDTLDEPDEVVTATISEDPDNPLPAGVTISATANTATITIRDNDPTIVSLARVSSGAVTEGSPVEFTVTLGRALVAGETIDVPLSIGGTGVTADEWSLDRKSGAANTGVGLRDTGTSTPKVRFSGAGARTATLELTPTPDGAAEGSETFTVALGSNSAFDAAALGTDVGGGADPHATNNDFTVTVNDGGMAVAGLVFNRSAVTVPEGGTATYTVQLATQPTATVTVTVGGTGSGVTVDTDSGTGGAQTTLTFNPTGGTKLWSAPQTVTVSAAQDSNAANEMVTLSHSASGGNYGSVSKSLTVTVMDAMSTCTDCVWITGGSDITEGGNADFVVWANPAPTANLTVPLWVYDARGHSDFLYGKYEGSEKVTILAGQNSAMFTVPTYDDVKDEADGDVRVRISSGRAGGKTFWRRDPYTASVTVRDDDASITTHDPPDVYASVSGSAVTATKTVPNNTTGEQVCFGIAGGAYPAVHVNRFKVNYRMRAGTREFWRSYVWLGRDTPFGTRACLELRTLTARCGNPATYTFELLEGGQSVTRDRVTRHDVTLDHYDISTSNPTAAFTVTGDACPMRSEQVLPGGTPPEVTVSADRTSVTEGGDVTFTVTANPAPAHDLAVDVTATEEMGAGADQKAVAHLQTVTVFAGTTSAMWTLTTMSDEDDLADGTVEFRAFADQNGLYTLGTPSEVTVTLLDDDGVTTKSVPDSVVTDPVTPAVDPALVALVRGYAAETWKHPDHVDRWMRVLAAFGDDNGYTAMTAAEAQAFADNGWQRWVPVVAALAALEAPVILPAVTVSAGADVTEGGDATFTVTADPAPAAELPVTVTVATAGEFGVTAGSRTVPIPVTGSATLTLATTGDEADEPDGSVSVTVAAGDGYTVGDPASGTVAIADDDPPAVATVDAALVAQVRGYAAETHHGQAHVDRWKRVLAAFGDDNGYTAMTAAEAQTHADKGWQRWVPVAAALAALEAPVILPAVTVSAGADVTEGGDAVFTVTADPAPAAALSVTVTVATAGEFGVTAGSRTVPIPTTGSATLTLATSDDGADEPDGSVSVTVAAGDGYTVGDPASGTVAVRDDDAPLPEIAVSAGDAVTEGGDATFTVTANPAPAAALSVTVTVATDGDFGIASGTQTVSIPTTGSATLTLATSDDGADEPDGSVSVTVAAGDGYTVGSPASGSVSIADDDLPPPVVSIAATAASVTEGGAAAFTLTADRAPDADLTVTLSVAETGGGDHVAAADEGPATAVIAKGATEAVFSVATVDDDVDEPDGSVTVTLKDGGGYTVPSPPGNAAAVTVSDDDAAALPSLSVADVTVTEGAWMEFTVRLSAPSAGGVSVKVSTRDSTPVSATARDYWPISGRTVSFRAGETERSVGVIVYDDSHDEEAETFEFVLSDARGAAIGDGVAVGTITNDDPMPAAWLARFGRTVAEQALDGIAGRMSADRTPGMQGSIAGQALSFDPAASDNPGSRGAGPGHAPDGAAVPGGTGALALADVAQALGGHSGQSGPAGFGHDAAGFGGTASPQSQTMTARDALLGSSFSLTGAADGSGGSMAFWGRAAQGGFDGREGTFSLDGTVTTGMLGADYARGKWLVGLALAQSEGEGDYRDSGVEPRPASQSCPDDADAELCRNAVRAGDGKVEASLTAAIPYAALQVSERLKLWGAAGYGTGEVTLKTALGGSYRADTSWSMAAAGLRGDLLAPPAEGSGPALAVTSDALWTRSSSEKTRDLAASESDATRLRLGLEGSYRMALESGGHLTPKLEVGARHDGGDAETGFGVELGGGVAWSAPALGLSLDVSGRTLIAHGNDDLKDRGYAAALAFDPDPATGRGPSLSLRQEFGGQAQGGLDALFQPATLEDRSGSEATSRWAMEAAYGFPAFGGRWTGSPHVGLGFTTGARDYSVGWRLTPEAANAPDLSFDLRATRRESDTAQAEHTVGFEITARW